MRPRQAGKSTHSNGSQFFNPSGRNGLSFRSVPRMLVSPRKRWPWRVRVEPKRPPALEGAADVTISFIGHSTFLIQSAQGNILTDPVFSTYAGPLPFLGPRRVHAPGVRFEDLPDIAVVLLSHNHYDHCDVHTLRRLAQRHNPLVITPLGNGDLVRSAGIRRIEELDWWMTSTHAPFSVTVTPAQHFSARTPFDRNKALWGSFAFELVGRRIYFAGDTGYGEHFKSIRARLGRMHVALLPIGAYEPRWFMKDIHMDPAEAVQASRDLDARQSVAMHFGTFQLTPEGIDEPVQALRAALHDQNAFQVLAPGDSFHVP